MPCAGGGRPERSAEHPHTSLDKSGDGLKGRGRWSRSDTLETLSARLAAGKPESAHGGQRHHIGQHGIAVPEVEEVVERHHLFEVLCYLFDGKCR